MDSLFALKMLSKHDLTRQKKMILIVFGWVEKFHQSVHTPLILPFDERNKKRKNE
jgi:hypothetical protein